MTRLSRREISLLYSHTSRQFFPCPTDILHEMMEITRLRVAVACATLSDRTLLRRAVKAAKGIYEFDPTRWHEPFSTDGPMYTPVARLYKTSVLLYALLSLPPRLAACFGAAPDSDVIVRTPANRRLVADQMRRRYTEELLRLYAHAWVTIPKMTMSWPTAVLGVAVAGDEAWRRQFRPWLDELAWSPELSGAVGLVPLLEEFWASGKTEWDDCWYEPMPCVG